MSESETSAKDHVGHDGLGSHLGGGCGNKIDAAPSNRVGKPLNERKQATADLRVLKGLLSDAVKAEFAMDDMDQSLDEEPRQRDRASIEAKDVDAMGSREDTDEEDGAETFYALSLLDHERGSLSPDEEMERYASRIRTLTTFTPFRSPKQRIQQGAEMYPERPAEDGIEPQSYDQAIAEYRKPKTLLKCLQIGMGEADQPCPFLSCKGHMFSEDSRKSWRLQGPHYFEDGDPVPAVIFKGATCSYREFNIEHTLEEIGASMWITRERIRQIEERAMIRIRSVADMEESEFLPQLTQSAEEIQRNWLGSIWTSERGGRRWMIIEFGDNKAKMMPVDSDGIPVSVGIETLARNFKLVFDGDSPDGAAEIVRGMEKKQSRRESRAKELVADSGDMDTSDAKIFSAVDSREDVSDER